MAAVQLTSSSRFVSFSPNNAISPISQTARQRWVKKGKARPQIAKGRSTEKWPLPSPHAVQRARVTLSSPSCDRGQLHGRECDRWREVKARAKEKYHCRANLLFILCGFSCFAYVEWKTALLVWSNTNQSYKRSANCYSDRRFAIPEFWQMQALHGNLVFPIKWCHVGAQKWSSLVEKFWAPSWHHLMGKTCFPWSACICQNPRIANLLFQ